MHVYNPWIISFFNFVQLVEALLADCDAVLDEPGEIRQWLREVTQVVKDLGDDIWNLAPVHPEIEGQSTFPV